MSNSVMCDLICTRCKDWNFVNVVVLNPIPFFFGSEFEPNLFILGLILKSGLSTQSSYNSYIQPDCV